MMKLKKLSKVLNLFNLQKESSKIIELAKTKNSKEKEDFYRPLPDFLEVKKSKIEGSGLFSKIKLKPNTELGITHVRDERFQDGYVRTPLGGFFNHSNNPNCEAYPDGEFVKLRVIKEIQPGEELTATYWLYNPEKEK